MFKGTCEVNLQTIEQKELEQEKIKNEQKESGINDITPSTEEEQDNVFNEICAAAIQAFNKK